jgi:hypothetical protein
MTAKTTRKRRVGAEARALMQNPAFQATLAEGEASAAEGLISTEDLERELGIAEQDKAIAREYLDALDRPEEAQGCEVTNSQARLLKVVLTGARYLRRAGPLAELAEYTGLPAAKIRAAAVALGAVGLDASSLTNTATPDAAPPA